MVITIVFVISLVFQYLFWPVDAILPIKVNISTFVPIDGKRLQRHNYKLASDDIIRDRFLFPHICDSLEFFLYDECMLCLTSVMEHWLVLSSRPEGVNPKKQANTAESTIHFIAGAYAATETAPNDAITVSDGSICLFGEPNFQIFSSIELLYPSRRIIFFENSTHFGGQSPDIFTAWIRQSTHIHIIDYHVAAESGAYKTECGVLHVRGLQVNMTSVLQSFGSSSGSWHNSSSEGKDVIWEKTAHWTVGNTPTHVVSGEDFSRYGISWETVGRWPTGSEFNAGSSVSCAGFRTHVIAFSREEDLDSYEEVWLGKYNERHLAAITYVLSPPALDNDGDDNGEEFTTEAEAANVVDVVNTNEKILTIVSFPYNGEPIAILHVQYLYELVDYIVIIESRTTHSGIRKSTLFLESNLPSFLPYINKLKLIALEDFPEMPADYSDKWYAHKTKRDPNFNEAEARKNHHMLMPNLFPSYYREEYQREYVTEVIRTSFAENQRYVLVMVDADEIMGANAMQFIKQRESYKYFSKVHHCSMDMFYYNFKWRKLQAWHPPFLLNDVRARSAGVLTRQRFYGNREDPTILNCGWHGSYFSKPAEIKRKIESFLHIEYDLEKFKNVSAIMEKIESGIDLYSRDIQGDRGEAMISNEDKLADLPEAFQLFNRELMLVQSSVPYSYAVDRTHIVISFESTFLIETARGLRDSLQRSGFKHIHFSSVARSVVDYRRLVKQMNKDMCFVSNCRTHLLQIVLGAHHPAMLFPHYLVFHIENTWEPYIRLTHYKKILSEAQKVFLYSEVHRKDVNEIGGFSDEYSKQHVAVIPMYSQSLFYETFVDKNEYLTYLGKLTTAIVDGQVEHSNGDTVPIEHNSNWDSINMPGLVYAHRYKGRTSRGILDDGNGFDDDAVRRKSFSQGNLTQTVEFDHNPIALLDSILDLTEAPIFASERQNIDILFVCSDSTRRMKFARSLHERGVRDGINIVSRYVIKEKMESLDIKTRELLSISSKVVVNFHMEINSVLETHRINNLLALGKAIVSERSTEDPALDAQYEDAVIFVDSPDELYVAALELVRNDEKRRLIERKALGKYRMIQRDNDVLKAHILEALGE